MENWSIRMLLESAWDKTHLKASLFKEAARRDEIEELRNTRPITMRPLAEYSMEELCKFVVIGQNLWAIFDEARRRDNLIGGHAAMFKDMPNRAILPTPEEPPEKVEEGDTFVHKGMKITITID